MRRGLGFHNRRSPGVFNPATLFAGGTVQGAWYDPSDLTTLFQDSAGTTPVTAVEQAVGLMLDKSKGLVLTQFSTNDNFASGGTGWTGQAGWTVTTGSASVNSSVAGSTYFRTSTAATTGVWYLVTVVVSSFTSGQLFAVAGTNAVGTAITSTGTFTYYVSASGSGGVGLIASGATTVATITSLTVRALPGNHAYQTTSASRPTLRARYNLLTYSEQFNDAAWTKRGTATITPNDAIAPDGTLTADRLSGLNTFSNDMFNANYNTTSIGPAGVTYLPSIYIKRISTSGVFFIGNPSNSANGQWDVDLSLLPDTWVRITPSTLGVTVVNPFTTFAGGLGGVILRGVSGGALSMHIWGAQQTLPAVFPSNTYQRVGAATDYATGAAFPPYLFFDGTDDSLLTNSVDFATVTSDGQARRNLLLNPTQFDASTWTAVATTVTANSTTAPDSSATADTITENTANTSHSAAQFGLTVSASTAYTLSTYVKANGRNFVNIRVNDNATNANAASMLVNVQTGSVTGIATAYGTFTAVSGSVVDAGSGWYRLILSFTTSTAAIAIKFELSNGAARTADGQAAAYLGDGTSGIFLWGAQLETGSTATAFQNIGTDRMLVVAGVTKQSDAAIGMLCETSANAGVNNGSFAIRAPFNAATANYGFASTGTASVGAVATTYLAPITNVVTGIGNIGAPEATLRVNGASVATVTTSQGTGNYGNYPLYIGRRNNATLPFNGNIYSLIIAGQSYSSGQISSTESWVAAKTPLGTI